MNLNLFIQKEIKMEKEKSNSLFLQYRDLVPDNTVLKLKKSLDQSNDDCEDELMMTKTYNPTTVLLFSIFLGGFGVDRFYIKDIGMGVCKLIFVPAFIIMKILIAVLASSVLSMKTAESAASAVTFIYIMGIISNVMLIAWIIIYLVDIFLCLKKCKEKNFTNIMSVLD